MKDDCDEVTHRFTEAHVDVGGPSVPCKCGQMEVCLTPEGLKVRTPDLTALVPTDDFLVPEVT